MSAKMFLRYPLAAIVGGGVMVCIWVIGATAFPFFRQLRVVALLLPILAGLIGGGVVALILPSHRIKFAGLVAFVLVSPMLYHLLHSGFSHFSRNPFLWYWPMYVPIAAMIGGLIVVKLNKHYSSSA